MEKLNRAQIVTLSNAAYQLNRYTDAKKVIIAWLKKYPNDLWIRYRLAIILYKMGEYDDAIRLCELIVSEDPEFAEVWGLLAVLYPKHSSDQKVAEYRARKIQSQDFSGSKGLRGIFQKNVQDNDSEIVMENDEFDILSAIANAKNLLIDDNYMSSCRIVTIYNRRWPRVIQFKLILGHILNQMGRDADGMAVIQSAVNSDLTDQVGKRIWSSSNPYQKLWANLNLLMIDIDGFKLPFNVVKLAGLENINELIDQMPEDNFSPELEEDSIENDISSDISAALEHPDVEKTPGPISVVVHEEKISLDDLQKASKWGNRLNFLREGKSGKTNGAPITEYIYRLKTEDAENGSPVYVIMSTVSGLIQKYGSNNKDFINQEMHSVADAVSNRKGWETQVFYPDEFASVGSTGLSADSIHQALIKLDTSLREKNKMIGALLIVGDDDVVPFFRLKNPTSDNDTEVLSDAPYSVIDTNSCYEMQWQVGRLPGDASDDPGYLLQQLRNVQNHHIMRYSGQKNFEKQGTGRITAKKIGKCIGYTCAAWVTPSSIVYKTIADTSSLLLCPSVTSSNFPVSAFSGCDLGYFNLHGIKGHPNWYGKKRVDDDSSGPTIPVALEIKNVDDTKETPKVVFSECCYGGETPKRTEKNSLCLHFLGKATRVFVGSTAIAYGALNDDLIAADLLGYLFWKHLISGITCGEAFRRAKKNLATEMEQKYGGLDAEMQKTLLSFVYYGDPLYTMDDSSNINNMMQRSKVCRIYELLGEESNYGEPLDPEMSSDIYREIKNEYRMNSPADDYSQYMVKKQVNYNRTGKYTLHSVQEHSNYIITYVKNMRVGNMTDRSVVRVTVRDDGVIQKVSFSR